MPHSPSLVCKKGMVEMAHLMWGGQPLDYSWGSQLTFDMLKPQLKHFHFWRSFRSLEVVRGQQNVKHWIRCCNCIPGIPSFRLICIKPQLKHFHFWRSLEVVRGHQKVKQWISCCYCIPWVPGFRLICIKPQLKIFLFVEVIIGHYRSLEVI